MIMLSRLPLAFLALLGTFVVPAGDVIAAGYELSPPAIGLAQNASPGSIASNGVGYLALIGTDWPRYERSALMPLDSRGRRTRDIAQFASYSRATVVRLGDHYLMRWHDEFGARLSEVSPDGDVLRDWASRALAALELYGTRSGNRILLLDRSGRSGFLFTAGGELVANIAFETEPFSGVAIHPGEDAFIWTSRVVGGVRVHSIALDGTQRFLATLPMERNVIVAVDALPVGDAALMVWVDRQRVMTSVVRAEHANSPRMYTVPAAGTGNLWITEVVPWRTGAVVILRSIVFGGPAEARLIALPLDGEGIRIGEAQLLSQHHGPDLTGGAATNGSTIVVNHADALPAGMRAVAISFDGDSPAVVRREVISFVRQAQLLPKVASDRVHSLVVWQEPSPAGSLLTARLLSPTDGPVRETFTLMQTDGVFGDHAVAYGGGIYLVVVHWWKHLLGFRVASDGTLLDEAPFTIAAIEEFRAAPAVASDGSNFLVVYKPGRAAVVTASGAVLSTRDIGIPRPTERSFVGEIDVAWDGSSYVLAWTHVLTSSFPGTIQPTDVRAVRLSAGGTADPATMIVLADDAGHVRLASSDTGVLATFSDWGRGLYAAWVPQGLRAPAPPVLVSPVHVGSSKPQYDGREFAIAARQAPAAISIVRIDPRTTGRREVRVAAPDHGIAVPIEVAVAADGTAAAVRQELRRTGTEPFTWRVVVYEDGEMTTPRARGRLVPF